MYTVLGMNSERLSIDQIKIEDDGIRPWEYKLLLDLTWRSGVAQRLNIRGTLPAEGPAYLFTNHVSLLDPPICYLVAGLTAHRTLRMVGRDTMIDPYLGEDPSELMRTHKKSKPFLQRALLAFLANLGHPIPINRTKISVSTVREVDRTIDDGQIVAVSILETRLPERDLLEAKDGAAYFALRHPDVPIFCAGISGSQISIIRTLRNIPIEFHIDQGFTPREHGLVRTDRASVAALQAIITDRVAHLVPPELRKHYTISHTEDFVV